MVNLLPVTPLGLRDFFARRNQPAPEPGPQLGTQPGQQQQHQQQQPKNPLTGVPSTAELEAYPPPASFVVQGEVCDQKQSPLFSKIPPEIRNEIFRLALREYFPEGREWDAQGMGQTENAGYGNVKETASYVKRPGYEGLKTVDTDLLRTCKRVYEETKMLPLQDLEICFYMGHKERVPKYYTMTPYTGMNTYAHPRMNWFKPEHWARISHFHVFGQMYALRQGFRGLFRHTQERACHPASLTLTLRYTDWWYWESNDPIYPILPQRFLPMADIEIPSTVQEMSVEFESIEPKLKELEGVVADMFQRKDHWVWKRRDGRVLKVCGRGVEGDGVRTWRWTGPARFGGRSERFAHHGEGEEMGYVVKVVTWRLVDQDEE
ncbi:hypothetical protein BU23DRAFT_567607 [Bimuria novae-zelandiae CBS 107.79]|uniref:Uncharacterized protein n=1 Tax=Bimuria novae-zelandiae CBS 107.79 TaxID=1447943 RepID=A0A6A5VEL6_9PLEO|nr:hypothetical protein BU23DRAFT_567607 [Bimuria novae-zelandiae CBS 107.79]